MSAILSSTCTCGSIGAPKEIRRCEDHHIYWLGDKRLDSVTSIIKKVMPADYSGIDAAVLANARLKGIFIDAYFSEWLNGEYMMSGAEFHSMIAERFITDKHKTAEQHADDAEARLSMLVDWWIRSFRKPVGVQQVLFSEKDGVAGTFDVATKDLIIDLKVVSTLQPNYALQLGAYLSMDKQQFPLRDAAILHVTKDAVKLVKYDGKRCKEQWRTALAWYRTTQELEGK